MQTGGGGRDFLPTHNLGVQLGVKLPTGKYGGQNVLTGATVGRSLAFFSSGPNSTGGQALDTSMQHGTGSTDAFVNGQFQSATLENLHGLGQDYRSGTLATVSVGLRYEESPRIVPQFQINVTRKGADQGALSDTNNDRQPGVSAVHVDFDRKLATVTYNPDRVRPESLTRATTHAGYPSTLHQ